jgi:hypothetical protein
MERVGPKLGHGRRPRSRAAPCSRSSTR